jgi:hypothetical protein
VPLDDDPLTSPSFPAINASDSRSYRTSRSDSQPRSIPAGPAYGEPGPQRAYPAPADPVTSPPAGYPVQSGGPSGNPYGSFVSQPAASYPQEPASHQDASYGRHHQQQQPGYGQPAASGWYDSGSAGQTPAFTAAQQSSYLNGANVANGLDPAGYHVTYQGGQPETVAYAQPGYGGAQPDQRGYPAPEPSYGPDGYQGYQGYGTGSY